MTTDPTVAAAIDRWDDAVRATPELDDWIAGVVHEQVAAGQVTKDGRARCTVARPHLLGPAQVAADQAVVSAVAAALVAAGGLVLADDALGLEYLGPSWTTTPSAPLLRQHAGYPQELVMGRFDGVAGPDGFTVFEFNGGMPGGMVDTDAASRLMAGWPAYAATAQEFRVDAFHLADGAIAALRSAWEGFGGSGSPFTVLAMPDELVAQAGAHLPGLRAAAERAGIEFTVADPRTMRHERDALWLEGRRVDVAVRGFFTTMVDPFAERLAPVLSALRAGDLCLVSSLRSGAYGHKGLFAVVTDPRFDLGLTAGDRELVTRHVPWTRIATPGTTTDAGGSTVDLAAYVLADRENLVVKPAAGFGGAGVALGWECAPDQWGAAWDAAVAAGGHIVQRRVRFAATPYPVLAPGLPYVDFTVDHNPVVFNRRIGGYFTRLSSSGEITNITSGGSLAPAFVVS
jgi:hypothetical protein